MQYFLILFYKSNIWILKQMIGAYLWLWFRAKWAAYINLENTSYCAPMILYFFRFGTGLFGFPCIFKYVWPRKENVTFLFQKSNGKNQREQRHFKFCNDVPKTVGKRSSFVLQSGSDLEGDPPTFPFLFFQFHAVSPPLVLTPSTFLTKYLGQIFKKVVFST